MENIFASLMQMILWHKDKLKIQIEFMEKNKYLATHTSYKIKNKNNKIIGQEKQKKLDFKSC